jgi:hypothetical protein
MKKPKRVATFSMKEIAEAWDYEVGPLLLLPWSASPAADRVRKALRRIARKRVKRGMK